MALTNGHSHTSSSSTSVDGRDGAGDESAALTPVSISYSSLIQEDLSPVYPAIEAAFGSAPTALGLILLTDLPSEFAALRENALRAAATFAQDLPQQVREKYTDPESYYSFGWSHGKEIMNGKPDLHKGSYYANPTSDDPEVEPAQRQAHPSYLRPNIWPSQEDCPGFEQAFKDLARFMTETGKKLAKACDHLVGAAAAAAAAAGTTPDESATKTAANGSVEKMISHSQCSKARLLHYYPPPGQVVELQDRPALQRQEREEKDSWCGDHLDHSLLTALCPAMYLFHPILEDPASTPLTPLVVPAPTATSGLFIRTRAGKTVRASLPPDVLAFQTGEALELLTGGKLKATPHYVAAGTDGAILPKVLEVIRERVDKGRRNGVSNGATATKSASTDGVDRDEDARWAKVTKGRISRETMAVFLQPSVDDPLTPTETFGQFTARILSSHYEESGEK